jgi:protein O-mannosyl-transferase
MSGQKKKTNTGDYQENGDSIRLKQYSMLLIFILLVTTIVFLPIFQNEFTNWDDDKYVTESPVVRNGVSLAAFKTFTVGLYTPLTTLSFGVDYSVWGNNPWGYHFTSLFLHLLNVILCVFFVARLKNNRLLALLVGLLFAIHPTHVEPVAWISSRKDLLYTFWAFVSLLAYQQTLLSVNKRWLYYAISFCAFLLACLSKPTAVGLPLVFCALDYARSMEWKWSYIWTKWPFWLASMSVVLLGIYGLKTLEIKVVPESGYNPWQVVCMAAYGFVFYVYKALIPLRLCNYHLYPFPGNGLSGEYLIAPFVLAIIVFLLIRFRKSIPDLWLGLLLFGTFLLPTYRFYPAGYPLVAERYFYLSSVGIFLVIGSVITKYARDVSGRWNFPLLFVFGLIMVVFSFRSFFLAKTWKNSATLWSYAIKQYPNLYYAYECRGKHYLKAGNKEAALFDFEKSFQRQSNNPDLLNTASDLCYQLGDTVRALQLVSKSIELDSTSATFYYNRANMLKAQGKYKASMLDYDKCLELNPTLAQAYNNRGVSKIFSGDTVGASRDFGKAVLLNPYDQMFVDNLNRASQLLNK